MTILPNESINNFPQPGIVIYEWEKIMKSPACVCTRNIERLKSRLNFIHAKILYIFPMKSRDSYARRAWRYIRNHTKVLAQSGYTFYFELDEKTKSILDSIKDPSIPSIQTSLKSLVLTTISNIANEKNNITVGNVVDRTLKYVNGLEIEKYLIWLDQEKKIRYRKRGNLFDSIINLI
jgi:hypothetical protein